MLKVVPPLQPRQPKTNMQRRQPRLLHTWPSEMRRRDFIRRRRAYEDEERLRCARQDRMRQIHNTLKNDNQSYGDNHALAHEALGLYILDTRDRHATYMPGFLGFLAIALITVVAGATANGRVSVVGSVASLLGIASILAALLHLPCDDNPTRLRCCMLVSVGFVALQVVAVMGTHMVFGILNLDLYEAG